MARRSMRMAELERLSGVPRETIHYYLREGLLPTPSRPGKTQALYDESHLERLRLIRCLREEKYLPVAVIRSILQAGLERPPSPDLDTLADVLRIAPHLEPGRPAPTVADAEVQRVAEELGLIGPGERPDDPSVARVLATVAEAVGLEGAARELTLDDLRVSAPMVGRLVEAEAAVFFDLVMRRGDMAEAVRALRGGRSAVARFLTSYRDLMLRRIVEALLSAVKGASAAVEHATPLGLSAGLLRRVGAAGHAEELSSRARGGDPAAANDLVWFWFALGANRELGRLSRDVTRLLRPRAQVLVACANPTPAGALAARLDGLMARAGSFPLGEVLAAEYALRDALRVPDAGEGVLERAVPALHRLYLADPSADADPLASALAYLQRGLVGFALPPALGRARQAVQDLEGALGVVMSTPGRLHSAVVARIEGNARLTLGRQWVLGGREPDGLAQLTRAGAIDPAGPLARAAESAVVRPGPEILAEAQRSR